MDGAIILSSDMKKILNANTLLIPDSKFITKETGTRHKAAERTAQQAETIVIAISERKRKITVYWKDISYVLEESSEILRKAAETLQILEKQKEIFDELLIHFNIAEITNIVVRSDICDILQRIEIIERISEKVKRYLIELGKEGVIVSMRLRELTKNLIREKEMILKDYFKLDNNVIKKIFQNMNFDILLENSNVMRIVFEDDQDHPIQPEGWRILHKTNLLEGDISLLINTLGNLENISDASKEKLFEIFKNELFTEDFIRTLDDLRNKIISGKKI
jgi:diadenylate cyclase